MRREHYTAPLAEHSMTNKASGPVVLSGGKENSGYLTKLLQREVKPPKLTCGPREKLFRRPLSRAS
jgi:hypothetical protein